MNPLTILRVAVFSPPWECYDYLIPNDNTGFSWQAGLRVQIPFGKRQAFGIVIAVKTDSDIETHKLKTVTQTLETQPLLPSTLLQLCQWTADYYHYPIARTLAALLPKQIRHIAESALPQEFCYALTATGQAQLAIEQHRAPKQQALLQLVAAHQQLVNRDAVLKEGFNSSLLKTVCDKGWLEKQAITNTIDTTTTAPNATAIALNPEQQQAINAINSARGFQPFLLQGITGSGKTEIYLQTIAEQVKQGKQVLVLVPEIALTPQMVTRFIERFHRGICVLHSTLSDKERMQAWLKARQAKVQIIIGTRSAIFVPLNNPGMIVLDEEHDLSFKQHSGLRYSARDLAILRGRLENIPVVLGSATPSLESLHNARQKRYQHLLLTARAGDAKPPSIHLLDLKGKRLVAGLSQPLLQTMRTHLAKGNQVLLFLNRRGFAPVQLCHQCGFMISCDHCDTRLVLHQQPKRLFCHHCGANKTPLILCPQCQNANLIAVGHGTERIEETCRQLFPEYTILRIDRDSTRQKDSLPTMLTQIHARKAQILIGTQMLAKGHHFPHLTLVAIVDADNGLFSSDFRAIERMAQLLVQVAGRAGRSEQAGEVLIQTHHPQHPLLQRLLYQGYSAFAESALQERLAAQLPPFSYLALIRADALSLDDAQRFLQYTKEAMTTIAGLTLLGPIPAPLSRLAGRHRAQLLLQAKQRAVLHSGLKQWHAINAQNPHKAAVRWSIDVDPQDML